MHNEDILSEVREGDSGAELEDAESALDEPMRGITLALIFMLGFYVAVLVIAFAVNHWGAA